MTMPPFKSAPVLLIGFNRPDFMAAQIAAVRLARPERLYIAVDGPRENVAGEKEACRQVRECEKLVDWKCEIKRLYRSVNRGCKYGVSEAITWFFENEPEGIILEDDVRPTIDFFRFATEMLERYRDDERIGAVCGFNFFNLQSDRSKSYHFSRHMDVWGWASWRRVWNEYDVEMDAYSGEVSRIIEQSVMTRYAKHVLHSFVIGVKDGSLSTWDVQFTMLFRARNYLSVVPKVRLTSNVGIKDWRASHTGYVYWGTEWAVTGKLDFPLVYVGDVVCDDLADYLRERMEGAVFPRGLTWLGCKWSWLCRPLTFIGKAVQFVAPCLFRL